MENRPFFGGAGALVGGTAREIAGLGWLKRNSEERRRFDSAGDVQTELLEGLLENVKRLQELPLATYTIYQAFLAAGGDLPPEAEAAITGILNRCIEAGILEEDDGAGEGGEEILDAPAVQPGKPITKQDLERARKLAAKPEKATEA